MLHIDMDSFFVSVEELRDPSLRGRAVAVGNAGPRGVVASASYEARRYGVRSGQPSSEARRRCPHLVFLSGRHGEYAAWSRRVADILAEYTPLVEPASIDEFYLDLGGCERLHGNFLALAERIGRRLLGELGLPSSLGLAANRTLAKIAAKVGKPCGVVEVPTGAEEAFMAPLPAKLIPGVGPATGESLARLGVRTAGELAAVPAALVERAFGAYGLELHLKARGLWRGSGSGGPDGPRSIGHETTFAEDSVDPAFLDRALARLVEKSAVRLRRAELEARRVTVKVRYGDFVTVTRAAMIEPAATERALLAGALPLLRSLVERRQRVRLVGVSFSRLCPAGYQDDLFRPRLDHRGLDACRCLDRVKERFGFEALRWASGFPAAG